MRKTLDKLISWTGLIMAAVLLVAGALLTWASGFVADNVAQQLADQHITMPAGAAIDDPLIKPYLQEYAGQPMTTGDQAKAYADHYILVHMNKASSGQTYSEISGQYTTMAKDPNADKAALAKLGDLRQTMFMGSTLRGLLLNAYAFGTIGKIAMYAAWAAFVAAAAFLVLGFLGLRHAGKVDTAAKVAVPAKASV